MELKPVRNTKKCRTNIGEADRLWDAHATGRCFANGANRPVADICEERVRVSTGRVLGEAHQARGWRSIGRIVGPPGDLPGENRSERFDLLDHEVEER